VTEASNAGERARTAAHLARGTGLVIVGAMIARGFGMFGRVLVAREYTPHEFGLLTLGLSVVAVGQSVAAFGLTNSVSRFIGRYRGQENRDGLRSVLFAGVAVAALLGVAVALLLVAGAGLVAGALSAPDLRPHVRVLALSIPFVAVNTVLLNSFRGFDRVREFIVFDALFGNLLKFGVIAIAVGAGLPFLWVAAAYTLAAAGEFVALAAYGWKELAPVLSGGRFRRELAGEMLRFSGTLASGDIVRMAAAQGVTLLLGLFLIPAQVGVYGAAVLLVGIVGTLYSCMRYLFLPLSSRLHASTSSDELRVLFTSVTRWLTGLSFPLAAVLIVLAGPLLILVFGPEYAYGAIALQILAASQFMGVWVGPGGTTLLATGHPRSVLWATVVSNGVALALIPVLVPRWGLAGAAAASAVSTLAANLLVTVSLIRTSGIHAFSPGFLKASACMGLAVAAVAAGAETWAGLPVLPAALALFTAFLMVSFGSIWAFEGILETDRAVFRILHHRAMAALGTTTPTPP
jgi:O-antigen/teichoic acid export membrane protein